MARRTAVIDIGSNSISLVAYEKSSRFAFHLIKKARASVRIGEGAYKNGGEITDEAMDRAFCVLEDYLSIAKNLKCRKVLCVATSALRDAPNRGVFINRVKRELKLNIRVIDGKKEAYFGGVAAKNLLDPTLKEFVTVDIGGGSTEFAKVQNGKVIDTFSLNLGTVRIKELFSDIRAQKKEVKEFIERELDSLPSHFSSHTIVGIGGTIRALSNAVMIKEEYPIKALHGFRYLFKDHKKFIKALLGMSDEELIEAEIAPNRVDTFREGLFIFYRVLKRFDAKDVISSKAGVREGVYLSDILRNSNHTFPHNFNVSIKSLIDRFAINEKNCSYVQRTALKLYDSLYGEFDKDKRYREVVGFAAKLSPISSRLGIYSKSENSFFFMLENLNFQFSHEDKLLIALLLKLSPKKKSRLKEYKRYKDLLPSTDVAEKLYMIVALSRCINSNRLIQKVDFESDLEKLVIKLEKMSYLCRECVERVENSLPLKIVLLELST
jgi:exopolyphosphatase/guanosine-5'-triphosphate,3'-diphosphate pyrophosphatase